MSINNLLKQSCTISTQGNINRFGKYDFGTATTYKCRFQKTTKVIHGSQKEDIPIDGIVFLAAAAVVGIGDKLTFGTDEYRIMRVEPMVDGNGTTRHFELMVQDWSN